MKYRLALGELEGVFLFYYVIFVKVPSCSQYNIWSSLFFNLICNFFEKCLGNFHFQSVQHNDHILTSSYNYTLNLL